MACRSFSALLLVLYVVVTNKLEYEHGSASPGLVATSFWFWLHLHEILTSISITMTLTAYYVRRGGSVSQLDTRRITLLLLDKI